MGNDIFDDPDFQTYANYFLNEVVPNMKDSAYVIIAPDGRTADVKIALEIGYAILLDKPLIVMKMPGCVVAEKLLRIADHIIEADLSTEAGRESIMKQFKGIMKQ